MFSRVRAVLILKYQITYFSAVYMAVFLYRNWAVFKHMSRNQPQIAFSTFIRLTLFSLIVTIAIA